MERSSSAEKKTVSISEDVPVVSRTETPFSSASRSRINYASAPCMRATNRSTNSSIFRAPGWLYDTTAS